LKGRR